MEGIVDDLHSGGANQKVNRWIVCNRPLEDQLLSAES